MLNVTIWGCRGSVPVSGPEFMRHGGATTCLEVTLDTPSAGTPERVILDCGTGLTELGKKWGRRGAEALVLQTHFHWDHIQGFPFFGPLFNPAGRFELWAARRDGVGLRDVLSAHMARPAFPVGLDIVPAELRFVDVPAFGQVRRGELKVSWCEVDHPSGCTAWRVDYRGASFVFSGDLEVQQGSREAIVTLARGADLLVMDAQYLPEEYDRRRGWGHSTPTDAVEVAVEAGVRHVVLTHHDPSHTDRILEQKQAIARDAAPRGLGVATAHEHMSITIRAERGVMGEAAVA